MAQQVIKINGRTIHQPDTFKFSFATTSTEGTERLMSGVMCNEPMFTVESYAYEGSDISILEMANLLQMIVNQRQVQLYYFSVYYGRWREAPFYVTQGSVDIGTLKEGEEKYKSLSFNIIGVNPL